MEMCGILKGELSNVLDLTLCNLLHMEKKNCPAIELV